ncbi:MAG: ComF family protein [Cellvibrio sp.]
MSARLFSFFHPPQICVLCLMHSTSRLCSNCQDALPFIVDQCRRCALPLEDGGKSVCSECHQDPPAFERAIVPLRFRYPVNRLVHRFKDRQDLTIGKALSQFAIDYCRAANPALIFDAACPVPTMVQRRFSRGFNPAEFVARQIAQAFNKPLLSLISKIRPTKDQRHLNRNARHRNIQGAFKVDSRAGAYEHLLLVDDVVTTGATARHLSELLIDTGVKSVTLLALARTPKPGG